MITISKKRLWHTADLNAAFTIVELLIVIVVIGILASIVIVSYTGIKKSAALSILRNDVDQSSKLLENYLTLNGSYPVSLGGLNNGNGLPTSLDTTYEYTQTASTYCLTATSNTAQTSYYYQMPGPISGSGACSGHTGYVSGGAAASYYFANGGNAWSSCVVTSAKKAYCWGYNGYSTFGDGTTNNTMTPIAVTNLAGKTITMMDESLGTGCAVASGTLYCWGTGFYGDGGLSGTGSSTLHTVSTSGVLSGKTITKLSVGANVVCAVASGSAYCWGDINRTGDGQSNVYNYYPVAVDTSGVLNGKTVTDISTTGDHTCVVASGGVYCWGYNQYGAVGNGTQANQLSPVAVDTSGVLNGKTVVAISSAGNGGGTEDSCVITSDGKAYCWGYNGNGELGNGTTGLGSTVPVAVDMTGVLSGKTITKITNGYLHTCALTSEGKIYCWGGAGNSQLGNGMTSGLSSVPVAVTMSGSMTGHTALTIRAGLNHTCAVADNASLYCWGSNNYGQLGVGNTANSAVPVLVNNLP